MFPYAVILIVLIVPPVQCKVFHRVITTLNYTKLRLTPVPVSRTPALPGQVPYIVIIKEPVTENVPRRSTQLWVNMCAGSIIDEIRVLTAAHCFEYGNFSYIKNPQRLRVVAGSQSINVARKDYIEYDEDFFASQWRKISDIIVHKNFHFPTNDIAMVEVETPFLLNGDVWYIRPSMKSPDALHNCLSAGYGNVPVRGGKGNETTTAVLVSKVTVIPTTRCSELWEMNMLNFVCTESVMTDMTSVDIGGPLVCTTVIGRNKYETTEQLEGIASGRTTDHTVLYVRVSEYYDWLTLNGYVADDGPAPISNNNLLMHSVLFVLLNYFF